MTKRAFVKKVRTASRIPGVKAVARVFPTAALVKRGKLLIMTLFGPIGDIVLRTVR